MNFTKEDIKNNKMRIVAVILAIFLWMYVFEEVGAKKISKPHIKENSLWALLVDKTQTEETIPYIHDSPISFDDGRDMRIYFKGELSG